MASEIFIDRAISWFRQGTTGFGLAGGFGALTAVMNGSASWKTMVPIFITAAYLIIHPEEGKTNG